MHNPQERSIYKYNKVCHIRTIPIICLSLIPDNEKKEEFLSGYYVMGFSDDVIKAKIEANNKAIWFDKKELVRIIENIGFSVINVGKPAIPFQSKYYFDITLCNGNPRQKR